MTKLVIPFVTCWVIRSTYKGRITYFQSMRQWGNGPANATIFRSEEAAIQMIAQYRMDYPRLSKEEILDPVPLEGALLTAGRGFVVKP